MIRLFRVATFFLILFLAITNLAHAESPYVLPYPSSMPGTLSYKIHLLYENISKYWYFGDFGQFDYNLKMSDKYLVEAKILFEYKQYLLGYKALQKSDYYFVNVFPNLIKAEKDNKNILQKRMMLKQAAQKHIEILEKMETDNPDTFNWQPEKTSPTPLNIKEEIINAVNIRKNDL